MKNKILILGSSGFIGQYLSSKIRFRNNIILSHNKNKRSINFNSVSKIRNYLKKNRINFIINLINDLDYSKILILNKNLITALTSLNIRMLFISSALVYGNNRTEANEKTKLKPFDNYTKSKVKLENLLKSSNLDYKIIRLSNVYDNNLDKKGLFKNIKDCLQNKTRYILFNNLNIYRNFIHVDDVCNIIEKIIMNYEKINKDIINIGAENIKLFKIIDIYQQKFNIKILTKLNKKKSYDPSIKVDCKFIKNKFNLKKFITLKKTINKFEI